MDQMVDQVMTRMFEAERAATIMPAVRVSTVTAAVKAVEPVAAAAPAAPICCICWDPLPQHDRQYSAPSPSCSHFCCAPCWNGYLGMMLLDGGVLVIRCPHAHPTPCSRVLDAAEVRQRLLTDASRAQYDHLAELARIAQDPSVRWCPSPNCNTLLRGGTSDAPHLVCHKCKAELCFRCSQRWHPSMSCADASAASLAELLSSPAPSSGDASASGATSSGEAIKSCPSCGMGIVRATGCNYLRCSRCTYEFCWLCMEEYTDHHFACQTNNQNTCEATFVALRLVHAGSRTHDSHACDVFVCMLIRVESRWLPSVANGSFQLVGR
jgi:hypothetical protein